MVACIVRQRGYRWGPFPAIAMKVHLVLGLDEGMAV